MKKLIMFAAMLAAVGMVAGCFTSATAYTEKTNPDGTKTVSRVSVIGTGDKASQVAAEGLFADGAADDLGAGVKTASANQKSTGIDGTLKGVGDLLGGIAAVMRAYPAVGAVPAVPSANTDPAVPTVTSAVDGGYTFAAATTEDGKAVSATVPVTISGDGISVVILGNRSTCSLCQSLWGGLDVAALSAALCGANVIDADAQAAPETYAKLRPQGAFSYPLVLVYEAGQLKGQFSGRGLTQATLVEKVKSMTTCK
jgi:hypothetical protein